MDLCDLDRAALSHRIEDLRWPSHRDLVIGRVLQSGGTDAITWLRSAVPDVDLASWIRGRHGHGLDVGGPFWVALEVGEDVEALPRGGPDDHALGDLLLHYSGPFLNVSARSEAGGVPSDHREVVPEHDPVAE